MIIGKKVIRLNVIDSTNDEARRLIAGGADEGTVVVAGSQTKGRGKPGYLWHSPKGAGVYLSAIVKPFRNPRDLSSITILGARAAATAIKSVSGLSGEIKLPNDVMVNGKKAGGVLVERLPSGHLIIGIGVNINNERGSFPEDIAETATSLKIESGKNFNVGKFAEVLVSELDREYLAYLERV